MHPTSFTSIPNGSLSHVHGKPFKMGKTKQIKGFPNISQVKHKFPKLVEIGRFWRYYLPFVFPPCRMVGKQYAETTYILHNNT